MNKFEEINNEMRSLYLVDKRPWVVGYSGGKDSTCVVQMVYNLIKSLSPEHRNKEVIIVSSNTLVESPFIKLRIEKMCKNINESAKKDDLPIRTKILTPELNDTFWVNLIGRGYPSPNKWFRWCTDRLKIKPMSRYIKEKVNDSGEVIILLGARKSESATRAQTMGRYTIKDFRLKKHSDIPNAFIYTPIEDLEFTDVWEYLLENKSPWDDDNFELARLYKKVNKECPLVIDIKTPACGGSRFGCWVCTVVSKDKAMEGLIEDGEEWLKPLLDFRNWLQEIRNDTKMREPIRKSEENKQLIFEYFNKVFIPEERKGHKVLGPFTIETRHKILRQLLKIQKELNYKKINLISPEELETILKIWVYEGDDLSILTDLIDVGVFYDIKKDLINLTKLEEICIKYSIPLNIIESLIIAEKDFSEISKRNGIYSRVEKILDSYSIKKLKSNI